MKSRPPKVTNSYGRPILPDLHQSASTEKNWWNLAIEVVFMNRICTAKRNFNPAAKGLIQSIVYIFFIHP